MLFKNVPNYNNYLIYEDGRVYNMKTKSFLKGSIGENGYLYYRLSLNGHKKMFYAHRLVADNWAQTQVQYPKSVVEKIKLTEVIFLNIFNFLLINFNDYP